MKQYLITYWEGKRSWCQVVGCTDIEQLRKDLSKIYDRFTIVQRADM